MNNYVGIIDTLITILNAEGEFVLRVNKPHTYETDISPDGLTDYNKNFYKITASGGKFAQWY